VWDMRTKACIHTLAGHSNTVASVKAQSVDPQVGLHDCAMCKCVARVVIQPSNSPSNA
ncbi:Pleiotropic regulator 1, partial [Exaiptasia diaphana]